MRVVVQKCLDQGNLQPLFSLQLLGSKAGRITFCHFLNSSWSPPPFFLQLSISQALWPSLFMVSCDPGWPLTFCVAGNEPVILPTPAPQYQDHPYTPLGCLKFTSLQQETPRLHLRWWKRVLQTGILVSALAHVLQATGYACFPAKGDPAEGPMSVTRKPSHLCPPQQSHGSQLPTRP